MQRGVATFTLDTGHCPPWLFERMVKLGLSMTEVLIDEYGSDEFVKRIADPVWFQSLGTVLAFDWNASGLTTILTAALKEAIRGQEKDLGIFICGGKGKTSRKTPDEILQWGVRLDLPQENTDALVYNSKMSAKVDSSLVQDDYQLYHHAFFFSRNGAWAVVQQGMNQVNQTARRYHWSDKLKVESGELKVENENIDFVNEPHQGIAAQKTHNGVLNMVANKSLKTREISTELVGSGYDTVMKDIQLLRKHSSKLSRMVALKSGDEQLTLLNLEGTEFKSHPVVSEDFTKSRYLEKILQRVTYEKPKDYESFLAIKGVGPKTVRALSLISEIIYGAAPSYVDPARYSFAHGGKDATPYPIDKKTYDQTIQILSHAVRKSKIAPQEKDKILRRIFV